MKPQFEPIESMPHFTYEGRLPTLNEYLAATGRKPQEGGKLKRQCLNDVSWCIRRDLKGWKTDKPVVIHYILYEPNMRRDHDNCVAVCCKVVHDALQVCGVIKNDGWEHLLNFTHDFYLDRDNPRIEVYIEEVS